MIGRISAEASTRVVSALVALLLLSGCSRSETPEHVALEYGRAMFASDAAAAYRLVSAEDRRVKDEATFRAAQTEPRGFARELVRQLASYVTAKPVSTTIDGPHATVKLDLTLPNANAPEVLALVHDWDEDALDQLSSAERRQISERLAEMQKQRALPTIDGVETYELVQHGRAWRVFLNWAGGTRLRFGAVVDRALPLDVTVTPADTVVAPGERVRVTLRARNPTRREITTRVGHRIEPVADASHLALVQCPLFVPITLAPGETHEFVSVYMLLADAPASAKDYRVTYEFPSRSGS